MCVWMDFVVLELRTHVCTAKFIVQYVVCCIVFLRCRRHIRQESCL